MEYGLTFTIFSLAFMIMLLYAFNMKRRNYSVRTKMFILLIFSGMAFAVVEILGVLFLRYSDVFTYFAFFWQVRNIAIVIYVYFFVCYYNLLIKGDSNDSLWVTIKNNNLFKILAIVLTLIMGGYCILLDIKPMDINNMQFVRGVIAYVLLGITSLTVIFAIFNAYKLRKTHKNETRTLVLIIILFICVLPIQMKIQHVSFMPFITMFVTYIMYQNIENPNIYLLSEVTKLKSDVDNNNKVDFLFNMSNDLIFPLNDIMSLCNIVSDYDISNKELLNNHLNGIKNASNILIDSIDNILNLSYSDFNDKKLVNVEYSSFELFKRIENSALSRLSSKNVKFIMDIDDNISSKFKGDINKIQRILFTVIDNATKNTSVGKINFNVSVSREKDIQTLHFKIVDTGCGIKSEDLEKIFDDSANNELAVCKRYLNLMGGNI